jgi:amidase
MEDVMLLDATAQADLVRRKEVSALELVEAAIDRIERLNPRINAVVTQMYAEARAAAARPLPDGPFAGVWSSGCAWTIDTVAGATGRTPSPDQFEPPTWALYEMGRGHSAPAYLAALGAIQRVSRDVARFFVDYDLAVTPTLGEPPVPLGSFDAPPDNPLAPLLRSAAFVPFTPISNMTGQPAMSVPLYWNAAGVPVGVHFIGRFGDEATLFRLAAQLEAARPWIHRLPPVS